MAKKPKDKTNHEPQLGQTPAENAERDAIHVAIIPLIAGERLSRGAFIKFKYGSNTVALDATYNRHHEKFNEKSDKSEIIGIVDPFMTDWDVDKGQRFWCVLFPGTVTGMRHHWTHPKFEVENLPKAKDEHEQWIRNFCDEWNFNYNELIRNATSASTGKYDRYIVAQGIDLHSRGELGEDYDLFWQHLEGLTGKHYDDDHREGMVWSCSC